MKLIAVPPEAITEIEHCWIPMSDGCRLAARIWLPAGATGTPVPAIIEYIPYRKRDGTRTRDEVMHRYFAVHGYAAVRIDIRGCGDSEGLLSDEYLPGEQDDCLEAIRWVAAQPWCSGKVGMIGKSWGGFSALQVAARRPPELGAIIAVCAADDRYADDAHYMGGCLLNENLIWGSVLLTLTAQPPDPELAGEGWRRTWLERLEHSAPFPEIWLRHQRRDAYWKHGSVCEEFAAITCPVYAVGGWADGYTNAVPRLLAGLGAPRKGLVGPWAHVYPHQGVPAPAIGFLQEALRWWDQWLRGEDTGIMDEPMYRVWMQESVAPRGYYDERPGRWVAEPRWPSPAIRGRRLFLNPGRLGEAPDPGTMLHVLSPQSVGLAAGNWCGFGVEGEMPTDQRGDDGGSLVFDSAPLAARLEVLGAPVVELVLSSDRPAAFVAVRLNDVAPGGASTRVTYGLLNLAHRDGHEHPEPLQPGRRYSVRLQLNDIAHAFPAGHAIRVAISGSYWPVVWPSPEPVTLSLEAGACSLELPVRTPRAEDPRLAPFAPPEGAAPSDPGELDAGDVRRTIVHDLTRGGIECTTVMDAGGDGEPLLSRLDSIGVELGHAITERFAIREGEPLSAVAEITQCVVSSRPGLRTRVETRVRLSATALRFHLQAELSAFEGGERVFTRHWNRSVARDCL